MDRDKLQELEDALIDRVLLYLRDPSLSHDENAHAMNIAVNLTTMRRSLGFSSTVPEHHHNEQGDVVEHYRV